VFLLKKKIGKTLLALVLAFALLPVSAWGLETSSKSVILVEQSTGKVLYEDNADEQLSPASVTKIMTLLLICEAIDAGKIHLEDMVPVSAYAASMGGSQVYLEEGE